MPSILVKSLDAMAESVWRFRDSKPQWQHRRHGAPAVFDPFPAYPHDLAVVEEAARHVEGLVPLAWDVECYVADREEEGRSNGFSYVHETGHYEGDTWVKDPTVGLIMLSGKRVPPHPAVTRYLVAHEMGHNVQFMLAKARGAKHAINEAVLVEYAKLRGLPERLHDGSGGRWHDSVQEVFACDFRIVVCNIETPYWPHPGIRHPRDLSINDLFGWWAEALNLLAAHKPDIPEET